jgi:hypothetical protein
MTLGPALRRFRSGIAVAMMLVIGVASFTVVLHRSALASPAQVSATNWLSASPLSPVKPCQKRGQPGTVNTCPLSGFGLTAILSTDAGCGLDALTGAAVWRLSDTSLPVQVAGLGLYRPPRSIA